MRKVHDRLEAKKKDPPGFQRPPGLTDERRVQIQAEINEWRENHPVRITFSSKYIEHVERPCNCQLFCGIVSLCILPVFTNARKLNLHKLSIKSNKIFLQLFVKISRETAE